MYAENIHEMYGVQSSKLFFQWGGLTHCDPLSMPSGALLQWLVCASLPGCGWRQPQASLPPPFLLSPSWASSEQTSCLFHFPGEGLHYS